MAIIQPLLEFYAGKNKHLMDAEKEMKIIVDELVKFRENGGRSAINNKLVNYNNHPSNKKIEENLAKAFRVSNVKIHWKNSGLPNAYTMPPIIPTLVKANSLEMVNKQDKLNMNIHIWVFEENVVLADLNEREMIAILLHEIGHNFYITPYMALFEIMLSVMTLGVYPIMKGLFKLLQISTAELSGMMKTNFPKLTSVYTIFNDIYTLIYNNPVVVAIRNISSLSMGVIKNITNMPTNMARYGAEKGSDSLATKYGYGPELITALNKMQRPKYSLYYKMIDNDLSFTKDANNTINDFAQLVNMLICTINMEPHPSLNVRYHNISDKLKSDLSSGKFDPDYKKELIDQIEAMDKIYDILNQNPNDTIQLKKNICRSMDDITGNKADVRELLKPLQDTYKF